MAQTATATRIAIRIAGGPRHIRGREARGSGDYVQTGYADAGMKLFASQRSAQQWIRRYSASILPDVWGRITIGTAADQGMLEIVAY